MSRRLLYLLIMALISISPAMAFDYEENEPSEQQPVANFGAAKQEFHPGSWLVSKAHKAISGSLKLAKGSAVAIGSTTKKLAAASATAMSNQPYVPSNLPSDPSNLQVDYSSPIDPSAFSNSYGATNPPLAYAPPVYPNSPTYPPSFPQGYTPSFQPTAYSLPTPTLPRISSGMGYGWTNPNHVAVDGYFRKNGTYVAPHMRTAPNHTMRDNFSARGNFNPYTGRRGHRFASH